MECVQLYKTYVLIRIHANLHVRMPIQEITIVRSEHFSKKDLLGALTTDEKADFDSVAPQKQNSWLLGRMALKKAAQRHFVSPRRRLSLQDIELIPQYGRAPRLSICSQSMAPLLTCALSHTEGIAIATVQQGVVGVDVERIRAFSTTFQEAFMTGAELAHTRDENLNLATQHMRTTLHWCIKEAYVKALGVGIRMHPRRLEVTVEYETQSATVVADGKLVSGRVNWTVLDSTYILVDIRL